MQFQTRNFLKKLNLFNNLLKRLLNNSQLCTNNWTIICNAGKKAP
uniref:Uncharacterized protein n=1 Tax=viral metagenome TaxID=1070528 RepID=A0A6C0EP27_9ZZZZ